MASIRSDIEKAVNAISIALRENKYYTTITPANVSTTYDILETIGYSISKTDNSKRIHISWYPANADKFFEKLTYLANSFTLKTSPSLNTTCTLETECTLGPHLNELINQIYIATQSEDYYTSVNIKNEYVTCVEHILNSIGFKYRVNKWSHTSERTFKIYLDKDLKIPDITILQPAIYYINTHSDLRYCIEQVQLCILQAFNNGDLSTVVKLPMHLHKRIIDAFSSEYYTISYVLPITKYLSIAHTITPHFQNHQKNYKLVEISWNVPEYLVNDIRHKMDIISAKRLKKIYHRSFFENFSTRLSEDINDAISSGENSVMECIPNYYSDEIINILNRKRYDIVPVEQLNDYETLYSISWD